MADNRQLKHRRLEVIAHGVLVGDEALPLARGAGVAREVVVGLETDLTSESGFDLALVAASAGEKRAAKLGLNEELGVESGGSRVKGCAWDSRVDVVGGGDGMRGEEGNDLVGVETGVCEAGDDSVDSVCLFVDK